MTRLLSVAVALLALAACQTPFGFGGEDWEGNPEGALADTPRDPSLDADGVPNGATGGATVLAWRTFCADGSPEGLGVIVDDDVWVKHVGFTDECAACAAWTVDAIVEDDVIGVSYLDGDPATCDCDCGTQGIEYVLTGLDAGTWTLAAGDDATTFDVE